MERIDLPALIQALQEHEQTADHALVALHIVLSLPLTDPEHAIVSRLIGLYTTRRDACSRIIVLAKELADSGFPEVPHDDVPPVLWDRIELLIQASRAGTAKQED
jgi:hypothetical protein